MAIASLPVFAAWTDAAILTLAGLVNLWNIRPLRALYADLDIPEAYYTAVGLVEILAAAFLASPEMRVYGIVVAAPILFGSAVLLLDHKYYAVAAPVMLMMAALVLAVLSVTPIAHGAL